MATAQYETVLTGNDVLPAPVTQSTRPTSRWYVGATLVGLACFAVLAVAELSGAPSAKGLSPRMFIKDKEVVNLMTDQRTEIGRHFNIPANYEHWHATRDAVARQLQHVSDELDKSLPGGVADDAVITEEEKHGLMHILKHRSDSRVQKIGKVFVAAMKDTQGLDKQEKKRQLVEKMQPYAEEIKQLHQEIFEGLPGRLQNVGEGDWDMLLAGSKSGSRRLQVQPVPVTQPVVQPNGVVAVAPPAPEMTTAEMIEEAKDILDQVESAVNAFKLMFKDQVDAMNSPLITSLVESSDDFIDLAECALDAAEKYDETKEFPTEKLMTCPLKLGDKGMEAITTLFMNLGIPPEMLGLPTTPAP